MNATNDTTHNKKTPEEVLSALARYPIIDPRVGIMSTLGELYEDSFKILEEALQELQQIRILSDKVVNRNFYLSELNKVLLADKLVSENICTPEELKS